MLPAPIEHRFIIDGEPYLLVEWTRGGERKIKIDYAISLTPAPTVLESIDGANLYAEAVARECLKEAPAIFWETRPAVAGANGTPSRVVTLDQIPRRLWDQFRTEVDMFLQKLFPPTNADLDVASGASPAEPVSVAAAETVSPVLRGRAE